jgi:hypothetical protein
MTPAQLHMHFELLFSATLFPTRTVGDPGAQGADVTGIQGCGVNTPIAADVAAATCGLASDEHIPKGIIFVIGMLSMMVAIGCEQVNVLSVGSTMKVLGAVPKLHCKVALLHTAVPIFFLLYSPIFSYEQTNLVFL